MPVLVLLLLTGVLIYFVWRDRTSTLTRNCRWRQQRSLDCWRCSACGAVQPGAASPKGCADPRRP